jgi:hypothetical protein
MREGRTVNVDGYPLCATLFDEMTALVVDGASGVQHAMPSLVVHLDRAEQPQVPPDVERLVGRFPGGQVRSVQEEPFWKEIQRFYDSAPNLFRTTVEWLDELQRAGERP